MTVRLSIDKADGSGSHTDASAVRKDVQSIEGNLKTAKNCQHTSNEASRQNSPIEPETNLEVSRMENDVNTSALEKSHNTYTQNTPLEVLHA